MILLPGHIEFAETLANLPFFYKEMAKNTCETLHVLQSNPNYLPEIADFKRLQEYLQGGEANEFVEFVDGYADVDELTDNGLILQESSNEWLGLI
jgi:Ran GTPase-activating protein (RanGAP) involved in mRNA processing and transport